MTDSLRADKWLWATRFFKTRSLAAKSCAAGKVKRAGHPIKAATDLRPGDLLEIPFPEGPGHRSITVLACIEKRLGAPEARACYEESTPPETLEALKAWQQARREAGPGRPTKRDRRELGRIRGFWE
jgi:ribosome-associated heat shock protein Hsp15